MAGRSPARFLAPIALIAFAFALYTVVQNAREPAVSNSGAPANTRPAATPTEKAKKSTKRKRRSYTVKSGDTPSGIAEKAGISLDTLMQLNPNLDPQTLAPGQRIKLSE
jgi:LysM repeat protein